MWLENHPITRLWVWLIDLLSRLSRSQEKAWGCTSRYTDSLDQRGQRWHTMKEECQISGIVQEETIDLWTCVILQVNKGMTLKWFWDWQGFNYHHNQGLSLSPPWVRQPRSPPSRSPEQGCHSGFGVGGVALGGLPTRAIGAGLLPIVTGKASSPLGQKGGTATTVCSEDTRSNQRYFFLSLKS